MKIVNGFDVQNPKKKTFPKAKTILPVVRSGVRGKQSWSLLMEAKHIFEIFHPLAFINDGNVKQLKQYCSERKCCFMFTPPCIEL